MEKLTIKWVVGILPSDISKYASVDDINMLHDIIDRMLQDGKKLEILYNEVPPTTGQ